MPVTVTTTRPLQVYTLATAPTHVAPVISVISSATIASDTTLAVTDGVDDPPPVSVPSPIVMPRSLRRDVPRHLATVARPQLPAFNPRRMLDGVAAALLRPSDTGECCICALNNFALCVPYVQSPACVAVCGQCSAKFALHH